MQCPCALNPMLIPLAGLAMQVSKFDDPHEAALSVVAESYRLWLQYETRTDDITMIILQFCGLEAPPPHKALAPGPAAE